mgnify:CR=1 FL=1
MTMQEKRALLTTVSDFRLHLITVRSTLTNSIQNQAVYVSATPGDFELEKSAVVAEQIIRPTGLLDPEISVRPTEGQLDDLVSEINIRTAKNQRTLVTTLTKKMAEDLTAYLEKLGIRVRYMHHDIDTVEDSENLMFLSESTFCVKDLIFPRFLLLPYLMPTKRDFSVQLVRLFRLPAEPHETARVRLLCMPTA